MTDITLPYALSDQPAGTIRQTRLSIDWLAVTVHASIKVAHAVCEELNILRDMIPLGHGGRSYQTIEKTPYEAKLYTSPVGQGEYWSLELPSQALKQIGLEPLTRFLARIIKAYRVNVNRLDLASDTQAFNVDNFDYAIRSNQIVTKYRRENMSRTYNYNGTGDTLYIGSRKSSKAMLRVYKKIDDEGLDEIFKNEYFTRVEMELKDERSTLAAHALMNLPPEQWHEHYAQLLNGMFVITQAWWQDWLTTSRKWWLKIIQRKPQIERIGKWLDRQVLPSLAAYVRAMAGNTGDPAFLVLNDLYKTGLLGMSDYLHKVSEDYSMDDTSYTLSGDGVLSSGRNFSDAVFEAMDWMKVPMHSDYQAMSDWAKKHLVYLRQLKLEGVDWDEYLAKTVAVRYD